MKNQNNNSSGKTSFLYYFFLVFILLILTGSFVNLYKSVGNHDRIYSADLLLCLSISLLLAFFLLRSQLLRMQDRLTLAEGNIRHYAITGKRLDPRLRASQVRALQSASDEEFAGLAMTAAEKGMMPEEIEKSIKK